MSTQEPSDPLIGVTGVVLAGGASRRMGRDKALLELGGETLITRAVRLLSSVTADVLVVGRSAADVQTPGIPAVPDDQPGLGPLGGIATALRLAHTQRVFVAACDMPLLQPALIRFLSSVSVGADAVVPRSERGLEPLHAVYSVACRPEIESCLTAGERGVSTLLARVRARYVEPHEWRHYDPDGVAFLNANTPGEWQRILKLVSASSNSAG